MPRPFIRREPKAFVIANHRIRATQVRVISDTGEALGVMDTRDALTLARHQEKDLVLVTEKADPPVAKIIELAKFKYQQQQREAESRKKARAQDIKEVRFTPFMGDSDFEARLNKVKKFFKKGRQSSPEPDVQRSGYHQKRVWLRHGQTRHRGYG